MSSEHDTKAHSTFGGSIADRWMNCAGSTALVASVPPRASTSYASEGTAAHALAEYALKGGVCGVSFMVGQTFDYDDHGETKSITVTKDMADAVDVYLGAVEDELRLADDAELYVEQRFVLPIATAEPGEVFGANDAIVYIPSLRKLTIFDYKHGAGVSVSAEDNAQLKFYAAGALLTNDWPVAEIELVIVQPRTRDADDNDGGVKRWALPVAEVIEFAGEAEAAIALAKREAAITAKGGPHLNLTPGKWCRWCDAAGVCPAKERQALAASTLDFNDITLVTPRSLPDVKALDTARLGQVLVAIEIIEEWGKQVRAQVDDLLTQGVPVPGWKLVDKIGRRKWIDDETKIAGHLSAMFGIDEDDSRPRKLVTITEAERLIKASVSDKDARKKALDETSLAFTLKESSGLTLVRESDKREGVDAIARDFGSVNLTL
jgi:hypothetical protein